MGQCSTTCSCSSAPSNGLSKEFRSSRTSSRLSMSSWSAYMPKYQIARNAQSPVSNLLISAGERQSWTLSKRARKHWRIRLLFHTATIRHGYTCTPTRPNWSGLPLCLKFLSDRVKPDKDQNHSTLCFLVRTVQFNSTGLVSPRKEAYAVLATLDRIHWIVATPEGFDFVLIKISHFSFSIPCQSYPTCSEPPYAKSCAGLSSLACIGTHFSTARAKKMSG